MLRTERICFFVLFLCAYGQVPEDYAWDHETFDNYQVNGRAMTGPYKAIREKLDFQHHGCYQLERQQLQDAIIEGILTGNVVPDRHPWIVFTAGSFFAGKSWVVSWMLQQGYLPLDVVRTDPDLIRTQLPEWSGYLERDGPEAAVMTQKEAGTCALIAQWEALRQGRHILVDGSLRPLGWSDDLMFSKYDAMLYIYLCIYHHFFLDINVVSDSGGVKSNFARCLEIQVESLQAIWPQYATRTYGHSKFPYSIPTLYYHTVP